MHRWVLPDCLFVVSEPIFVRHSGLETDWGGLDGGKFYFPDSWIRRKKIQNLTLSRDNKNFPFSKVFLESELRPCQKDLCFFHLKKGWKKVDCYKTMILEWQESWSNQGWQQICTGQKHIEQDHFDLDACHDHDLVRLGQLCRLSPGDLRGPAGLQRRIIYHRKRVNMSPRVLSSFCVPAVSSSFQRNGQKFQPEALLKQNRNMWVLPGWLVCMFLCVSLCFKTRNFEGEYGTTALGEQ